MLLMRHMLAPRREHVLAVRAHRVRVGPPLRILRPVLLQERVLRGFRKGSYCESRLGFAWVPCQRQRRVAHGHHSLASHEPYAERLRLPARGEIYPQRESE